MAEQTLPAVAKSVYTDCKKCGAERYHVVLAHTSATSAKVQCEICKSKKTYKIGSLAKKAMTGVGAKPTRAPSARGAAAKAAAHENEYQSLLTATATGENVPYNMKVKFTLNQKIQHPKFGLGVVKVAQPDKVEVVFQDEVRSLVHNRG